MINYDIDVHDIDDLTEPMWQACGLECPVMIGGKCRRDERDSRTNMFRTCPGWSTKFTNAAAEVVHAWSQSSGQSDDCGNAVEGDAWFALFRNPDRGTFDGPMGAGVILTVASGGEVTADRFESADELEKDWALLLEEHEPDTDTDGCEGHIDDEDYLSGHGA